MSAVTESEFLSQPLGLIGYGNQARAWAQNLRDSGQKVVIFLKPNSPSIALATRDEFEVVPLEQIARCKILALLIPDDDHEKFLLQNQKYILPQTTILYAHGYSFTRFQLGTKFPQFQHILFAPKAIASELRSRYLEKKSIGGVYSLENISHQHKTNWLKFTQQLAFSLGIHRLFFETTFEQETTADLFSEQALLCSLIPYSVKSCYEEMIAAGLSPELSFLEIWSELEFIVKAMVKAGPEKFFDLISPNALVGSEKGQQLLCDQTLRGHIHQLMVEIQSRQFDQEVRHANIDDLRAKIKRRWSETAFQKVFNQYQDQL